VFTHDGRIVAVDLRSRECLVKLRTR
jgi:hypothetical protein